MKIAALKGFLNIANLQIEGKSRMYTVEFLRGFKISDCEAVS
jgi:methionyl-tRNA formyltransferase